MPKKIITLDEQVRKLWSDRARSGVEGLALLHKCIENVAHHRDWDALSRFYVSAQKFGQGPRVAAIIRAAFGEKITFRTNVRHPTGGTFSIRWEGKFDLERSNTYAVVRDAVSRGISWDDRELGKLLPKREASNRTVSEEAQKKIVKHLANYLSDRRREGFAIGEIIALVQKDLELKKIVEQKHEYGDEDGSDGGI